MADFLTMLSALGGLGGLAAKTGNPKFLGPLGGAAGTAAAFAGGGGGGGDLGPVGGPRPLPQPIPSIDPGASSAAPGGPAPVAGPLGGSPLGAPDFSGVGPLADTSGLARQVNAVPDGPAPQTRRGPLARVGDFLGSDDGKAALFRAGATMLAGGNIGQGMMAGAGEVDRRKASAKEQARYDVERGQRDRQLDISDRAGRADAAFKSGSLQNTANRNMIDLMEAEQRARAAADRNNLDWSRLSFDQQKAKIEIELARMRDATQRESIAAGERNSQRSADASKYGADSARYTATENRAWEQGPEAVTKRYDENGNVIEQSTARAPIYGEIRYGEDGQAYRLDPFTGRPVPVTRYTIGTRSPLGQ